MESKPSQDMSAQSKTFRLTTTSYAVMSLLDTFGEATPYELKQTLEDTIENFWPVPHTTFYDEPARLAQAGYLSHSQERAGAGASATHSPTRGARRCACGPTLLVHHLRNIATRAC